MLTPTEWTTTSNNTSWWRITLIFLFEWREQEPIVLPRKCHGGHIMERCDECNNCTKFQLYTEKVVRDIKFFVTLHHFVSTKWHHKSSNLHKSKSCVVVSIDGMCCWSATVSWNLRIAWQPDVEIVEIFTSVQ